MTGRCQHRFGHEFNSGSVEREAEIGFGLPTGEKIPPEYLKSAGYRSMAVGFHPMERVFDGCFGFLTGTEVAEDRYFDGRVCGEGGTVCRAE